MAANQLEKQFRQFISSLTNAEGRVDLMAFLNSMPGASSNPNDMHAQMESNYKMVTSMHDEFVRAVPVIHNLNMFEVKALKRLSELGIPYWFAAEWLANDSDATCSKQNPLMCLPAEALALIYLWKQTALFAVASFIAILFGAILGILLSRRSLRSDIVGRPLLNVVLCLFLDLIGLASMLLPVVGNVADLVWGPLAALLASYLLKSSSVGLAVLLKEIVPVLDIIPIATIVAISRLFE